MSRVIPPQSSTHVSLYAPVVCVGPSQRPLFCPSAAAVA